MHRRIETLRFERPSFENKLGHIGTAPDGVWKLPSTSAWLGRTDQVSRLRESISSSTDIYLEEVESGWPVYIRSCMKRAMEAALSGCERSAVKVRDEVAEVVAEVIAEESWWLNSDFALVVPDITRRKPEEQIIMGTRDGMVILHNFTAEQITSECLQSLLATFSRAYSWAGTNLYNFIEHVVISKPKSYCFDTYGLAYRELKTIWLAPELFSGTDTKQKILTYFGHEIGHMITDDDILQMHLTGTHLPNSFLTKRKLSKLGKHRRSSALSNEGLIDLDEELACLFSQLVAETGHSRWQEGHDLGYLFDSMINAFVESGFPVSSELANMPLYWQRRIGGGLIAPLISIPREQCLYPVVQHYDNFLVGRDYNKEDY